MRSYSRQHLTAYTVLVSIALFLITLEKFFRACYRWTYVYGEILWENSLKFWENSLNFAYRWWDSAVTTGLSMIACVILMGMFAYFANAQGTHNLLVSPRILSWLALAMAPLAGAYLVAFIKAATKSSAQTANATE